MKGICLAPLEAKWTHFLRQLGQGLAGTTATHQGNDV